MTFRDKSAIESYHAHVYYDAETKATAAELREGIEARFDVALGRWFDRPIGPHPCWSYQVAFRTELFAELVPWLALNRRGLVILVHPNTGADLEDHRDAALWLGESQTLKLDIFD